MDAPDLSPEVRDPNLNQADQSDPIGPQVLPKLPRYLARTLALTGVAIGTTLAFGNSTVIPTGTWPFFD
jgi:hypothetical protein